MAYIGDVYVPVITELSVDKRSRSSKVLKPLNTSEPILVPMRKDLRELRMEGVLVPESPKTEDDFAEDLTAIVARHPAYNHINYAGVDGFIAADDVDIPKTAEIVNLREYSLSGKFLPRTIYERAYKINNEIIVNDFGIGFPAVIPLPVGATNVKLKSPWQTINLSSQWATLTGKDGDVPIYRPFPLFNAEDATTTGALTYLEEAYRLQTVNLDAQAEYAQWTTDIGSDIPKGTYKVVLRVRDDNVADDITVTVSGSDSGTILTETLSTGGTDFVLLETSEFSALIDETLTIKIEKATATTNVIEIDYCYLSPTYTARLAFDVDSEVDVGEVRVYDDMNSANEADWVRVYNKEHKFVGDVVIEDGLQRIKIVFGTPYFYHYVWDSSTSSWILGEASQFFNKSQPGFAAVPEKITIKEIDIDEVSFTIECRNEVDDGNRIKRDFVFRRGGLFEEIVSYTPYSQDRLDNEISGRFSIGFSDTYHIYDLTQGSLTNFYGAICIADDNPIYAINIVTDNSNFEQQLRIEDFYLKRLFLTHNSFDRILFGKINIPFYQNLFKEAENGNLSAGAYINRFIDDFSADSSVEYTVLAGTGWSWDTVNGELDAYSDTETAEFLQLNSLKFGNGTYSVDVRINSTNAVGRNVGILFGVQDIDNLYLVILLIDAGGVSYVKIHKEVDGAWSQLASAEVTATTGTWYNLKVDWDPSTGQIDVYFDGAATPTVSATDTTYSSGYAGLRAYVGAAGTGNLDASFDNLDIQAEEVTSSGNTCVIFGGTNHGGQSAVDEYVTRGAVFAGTDVPLGRYLAVARVKTTAPGTTSASFLVKNYTDESEIAIDGSPKSKDVSAQLTEDYSYIIRPIVLDSDDEGDNFGLEFFERGTDSNPVVVVDYFLLIPISGLESSQLFPQDLAFLSMVDPNLKRTLEPR